MTSTSHLTWHPMEDVQKRHSPYLTSALTTSKTLTQCRLLNSWSLSCPATETQICVAKTGPGPGNLASQEAGIAWSWNAVSMVTDPERKPDPSSQQPQQESMVLIAMSKPDKFTENQIANFCHPKWEMVYSNVIQTTKTQLAKWQTTAETVFDVCKLRGLALKLLLEWPKLFMRRTMKLWADGNSH